MSKTEEAKEATLRAKRIAWKYKKILDLRNDIDELFKEIAEEVSEDYDPGGYESERVERMRITHNMVLGSDLIRQLTAWQDYHEARKGYLR